MERLHARYPFLSDAREAVRSADVDLATLVAAGDPAVERGVERVTRAIDDGTVGEPRRGTRVELLSYPIARVLVSLVDQPALTRRYASAEARTASQRLREDAAGPDLRSADRVRLSLRELLAEFDLAGATSERPDAGFDVSVTAYLRLAGGRDGEDWRLVNRELAAGAVPVSRPELFTLLETAVEQRVGAELPFAVPEAVAAELDAEREAIADRLADIEIPLGIDTVDPARFPPCIRALLDRVDDGETLPHHAQFALTAFLASIGLDPDGVVEAYGDSADIETDTIRYQTAHVRADVGPVEYPPPSCATMQSFGDCVDKDSRCETISHPLAYYERALADGGSGPD